MTLSKEKFIQIYIKDINSPNFKNKLAKMSDEESVFDNITELQNFLRIKISNEFPKHRDEIFNEWKNLDFVKTRITDLANKYFFRKNDLEKCLFDEVSRKLSQRLDDGSFKNAIDSFTKLIENQNNDIGYKSIKSDFLKVFKNSLHFSLLRGFPENLENINSGIMTANAGDSHQFLFLARAILAGYECSNVDVRSSRYDAIVDYKNQLFKVQIKGIQSSTSSIQFKDRDRGGQGIDHKHERNKGKKITSKDCDIYAAVDKNIGICYLVPMKWVDKKNIDSIKLSELKEFKENWKVFDMEYFN